MSQKRKVLILCTGNSCRSIMAEALINHYLSDSWQAFSAGTHPSVVNPWALRVLREAGIETANLYSKGITEFLYMDDLDLVITLCRHADANCPVFPLPVKRLHIGIDDPVIYYNATAETALAKFRESLQSIKELIVDRLAIETDTDS